MHGSPYRAGYQLHKVYDVDRLDPGARSLVPLVENLAMDTNLMKDVQNSEDTRGIPIDRVGVCDVRYPITVLDRNKQRQHTVATINLSVDLPHQFKGTHMSRFIEIMNLHHGEVTMKNIPLILEELKERLEAERSHIEITFPYFLNKAAPVTKRRLRLTTPVLLLRSQAQMKQILSLKLRYPSPVCAHVAKRSVIMVLITKEVMSQLKQELARMLPVNGILSGLKNSSRLLRTLHLAPLYALLKREDEKHVTEQAYENPVFVEDLVRNVALRLKADEVSPRSE